MEIDNEVVENVIALGNKNANAIGAASTFYAVAPAGVNMRDHFETIAVNIAEADAFLFAQTNKFTGTYILCGPRALRFFSMSQGFKMMNGNKFGFGPYVAGECLGHKVIVTPIITTDDMYIGVNTTDASALVYATYMPIIPTQMLQYADGGTSQGFSTLYDIAVLNPQLVAKIAVVNTQAPNEFAVANHQYVWDPDTETWIPMEA